MRDDIENWILNFVEDPTICPYAKKARLDNQIKIVEIKDLLELIELADTLDVDVCIAYTDKVSVNVTSVLRDINAELMKRNLVVLEDIAPEIINGRDMSFGKCPLFFIQKLSFLNDKALKLIHTGYYDNWTMENLEDVVLWRFHNPDDFLKRLRLRIPNA